MRTRRILFVLAAAIIVAGCGANGSDGSNGVTAPAVAGAATQAPASAVPSLPACDTVPLGSGPLQGSDLATTFWVPRTTTVSADSVLDLDKTKPGQDAVSQLYNDGATLRAWIANDDRAGITVYTRVLGSADADPASEQVVLITSRDTRYPVYLAPSGTAACDLADLIDQTNAMAQAWAPGTAHTGIQVQALDGRPVGGGTVLIGTQPAGE